MDKEMDGKETHINRYSLKGAILFVAFVPVF